ncbi:MAG TPA: SEC-C metal-binding domain-containing protein [Phycisphaerae bacterium]|nr:SEC-C metal-binding domain-containing protein [Phycisphaerae bacterium]
MDPDADPEDWNYKGLSEWAHDRFGVQVSPSQLQRMDRDGIREALIEAALEQVEQKDCAAIQPFLVKHYAQHQLAEWANTKFDVQIRPEDLIGKTPTDAADFILERAHESYARREVEYPVEYALEHTLAGGGTENIYASEQLANWLVGKFGARITGDDIRSLPIPDLHRRLVGISKNATDTIDREIDQAIAKLPESPALAAWVTARFRIPLQPNEFENEPVDSRKKRLYEWGHAFLRSELTEVERAVLLQIYDSTWKDHLYAMDQLRESIGLRGVAERDPRIEYKREGSRLFQEFMKGIRDKVTDVIFRVRMQQTNVMKNVYTNPVESYQHHTSYAVATSDAAQQVRAERSGEPAPLPADTPPAAAPTATFVNETVKVGRNDPCPCGSGKKYKQCCGQAA